MSKLILLSIFLAAGSAPALAVEMCHGVPMPPVEQQQEPTVFYDVRFVSDAEMHERVNAEPTPSGIALKNPTAEDADGWLILLNRDKIKAGEMDCVLRYEKSHLPPNNYLDPPAVATIFKPWR